MKNHFKKLAAVLLTLANLTVLSVYAKDAVSDPDYFRVKDAAVTIIDEQTGEPASPADISLIRNSLAKSSRNPAAAISVGALANTGAEAWGIISNGIPSAHYDSAYASAIPGFAFNWANMTGWESKSYIFNFKVRNRIGLTVVNVKYRVAFNYNGSEESSDPAIDSDSFTQISSGNQPMNTKPTNGQKIIGKYITNFTVQPVEINIKWAWNLSMSARMSDPINIGTKTRPIAQMQCDLNWVVKSPVHTKGGSLTYVVTGTGQLTDITQKISNLRDSITDPEVSGTHTLYWE